MNIQQYIQQANANDETLTSINLSGQPLNNAELELLITCFRHNYQAAERITSIYLDCTGITTPPDLRPFVALKVLYLNNNSLTTSPNLSRNKALEELYLEHNQIEMPPNLQSNAELEILVLHHNNLILAPDVTSNVKLRYIDLDNNSLSSPPDVTVHTNLEMLCIKYNPLTVASKIALIAMKNAASSAAKIKFNASGIQLEHNLTYDILQCHFSILCSVSLPAIGTTEFKDAILSSLIDFNGRRQIISPIDLMRIAFDVRNTQNISIGLDTILNANISMLKNMFSRNPLYINTLKLWLRSEKMHSIEENFINCQKNKFKEILSAYRISRSQATSSETSNIKRRRLKI